MIKVKEGKIGRIRLKHAQDASRPSLEGAVKESVEPDSAMHADGWKGYRQLSELGYAHKVIRKEAAVSKNPLPKANSVVALLKHWLVGTYQGSIYLSHLDCYLEEFTLKNFVNE